MLNVFILFVFCFVSLLDSNKIKIKDKNPSNEY